MVVRIDVRREAEVVARVAIAEFVASRSRTWSMRGWPSGHWAALNRLLCFVGDGIALPEVSDLAVLG